MRVENFRVFGSGPADDGDKDSRLDLELDRGINVLVGENDSGKSAIVDAIRICLLTTAADFYRISRDDFHVGPDGRATALTITCGFTDLTTEEQATFLELVTTDREGTASLFVTVHAELMDPLRPQRISVTTRTGPDGSGPALDGAARELLKATYLRPLRDAEAELRSGRGSRLSQILAGYPAMSAQEVNDFDVEEDTANTLVGILRRAEHHLTMNSSVAAAVDDINTDYLSKFAIGSDSLRGVISVSGDATLARALERLELSLSPEAGEWTRRGLGYNNALFMAAELLLLGNSEIAPLLLIEEPEAHLHPQLQARIMDLLQERTQGDDGHQHRAGPVQVILTTHSPNLASAIPVEHLTLVANGRTFRLAPGLTRLDEGDYEFLTRFLDVTKAGLFFARAVAIVEGDAEAILLPALAAATGPSFNASGVTVVNVGTVGLFRYSRIFQREGDQIPVAVACIRDRDLVPKGTPDDMRGSLKCAHEMEPDEIQRHLEKLTARDGGNVRTFVSDQWTLEYDLAAASWEMATLMHQAVQAAVVSKSRWPNAATLAESDSAAAKQVVQWRDEGRSLENTAIEIYKPLRVENFSKPIAAQHAARLLKTTPITAEQLPHYLVDAFTHLRTGVPR
ncbi:SMC (structural maintenance of chromosomes) family protein (plasmid) [Rhodococcus opacus]|uniref:SMC (Structural maintenance of chromosomes) family protein n=1 Tax=Rhodococcus opacus TaxID=37919 RepID=A0A1B1KGL8_RHOOP|nr:AAA family ATPase [Rhodococcus opacus]ANS31765.1 SMC (structural maintenance of chromosomes) family protein [Rhodococcus opacus]